MADKKISALTSASTPLAGTEVLPIVQSGSTVKVAVSNLTAGRSVSALAVVAPTIGAGSGSNLSLQANGSTYATLTTAGNFGVSVVPSNWGSAGQIDLPNSASIVTQGTNAVFGANWYFNGNFIYKTTAAATYYQQTGGAHNWYSAASGTAGNTISSFPRTMGLSSGGNLTLDSGNLVVGTAGKGIDFSANTHAAGMTSELLNWYEEGTWTPALQSWTISGTAPTVTGRYTRIGREVYLYAQIAPAGGTVSYAAAAGTSYINGLPFTPGFNSGGIWTDASNAANTLDTNLVNTTGNAYAPTIAATADVIIFACHFSV